MIDDGALKGVDAVIALHVDSTLEVGKIRIQGGMVAAAVDSFRANVIGTGGHGAHPHDAVDPIWLATQVMNAMYAVPSRQIDPLMPSVLSLGVVRGGLASNVIPKSVYLEGTLRSMNDKVRERLLVEVSRCLDIAKTLGGDYTLEIEHGYPPMVNDHGVAEEIEQTAKAMLGEEGIGPREIGMGAEDFSYMLQLAPGAMFMLGTRVPGEPKRYAHTPDFNIDENALPIGSAMLAQTALRLLASRTK
jgi:amidohydrolase